MTQAVERDVQPQLLLCITVEPLLSSDLLLSECLIL